MKEFTIGKNDAGQRLDRWLAKTLPLLPAPLAQKYIRLKRVKVNGKGSKRDVRLAVGDVLQLYINDEFFEKPTPENAFLSLYQPKLNILYEDEHILLVDKRPGMVVHPDESERVNTLLTHIQAYLYQKKEWSPYWENSFAPALCNRIDRKHRRDRHCGQDRRGAADHEPEDQGPGAGEILPVCGPRDHVPPGGETGELSSEGRREEAGVCPQKAGARWKDGGHLI